MRDAKLNGQSYINLNNIFDNLPGIAGTAGVELIGNVKIKEETVLVYMNLAIANNNTIGITLQGINNIEHKNNTFREYKMDGYWT